MKRKLVALAAIVLSLGTTVAVADNNYVFDDAYWKQAQSTGSVHATGTVEHGKYDAVDNYIP